MYGLGFIEAQLPRICHKDVVSFFKTANEFSSSRSLVRILLIFPYFGAARRRDNNSLIIRTRETFLLEIPLGEENKKTRDGCRDAFLPEGVASSGKSPLLIRITLLHSFCLFVSQLERFLHLDIYFSHIIHID